MPEDEQRCAGEWKIGRTISTVQLHATKYDGDNDDQKAYTWREHSTSQFFLPKNVKITSLAQVIVQVKTGCSPAPVHCIYIRLSVPAKRLSANADFRLSLDSVLFRVSSNERKLDP
jgi:hypothetical protein